MRSRSPESRRTAPILAPSVFQQILGNWLEARAGIEPAYTDLQSAASPLRHRASQWLPCSASGATSPAARRMQQASCETLSELLPEPDRRTAQCYSKAYAQSMGRAAGSDARAQCATCICPCAIRIFAATLHFALPARQANDQFAAVSVLVLQYRWRLCIFSLLAKEIRRHARPVCLRFRSRFRNAC